MSIFLVQSPKIADDEWHRKWIQAWTNGIPDLSNHITIHAYKSDEEDDDEKVLFVNLWFNTFFQGVRGVREY